MKIGLMSQHVLGECLQNTNDTQDTHTVNTNQAKQCRLVMHTCYQGLIVLVCCNVLNKRTVHACKMRITRLS